MEVNQLYRNIQFLFCGMVFLSFQLACKQEPNDYPKLQKSDIEGYWRLETAYRNGSQTGTLDGMYMNFKNSDMVESNVLTNGESKPIIWSDSLFMYPDSSRIYNVSILNGDTLHFGFTMQGFDFDLQFLKSLPDSAEIPPSL